MKLNPVKKEKKSNLSHGFTLVETLVAVAILATSITGLIAVTARGINDGVFVKNKLTASYLSQEGVELVRNMRDTSALQGDSWSLFLANQQTGVGHCYSQTGTRACFIDGSSGEIFADECIEGVCNALTYEESSGTYGYTSFTESPFTRTIRIRPVNPTSPHEVEIISDVSWRQGTRTHVVSYYYYLMDWIGGSGGVDFDGNTAGGANPVEGAEVEPVTPGGGFGMGVGQTPVTPPVLPGGQNEVEVGQVELEVETGAVPILPVGAQPVTPSAEPSTGDGLETEGATSVEESGSAIDINILEQSAIQ